jgi:hypothetical protein
MTQHYSSQHYSPADLARLVWQSLPPTERRKQPESVLVDLFETMYFASFETDEGRPTAFELVYLDPISIVSTHTARQYWQTVPLSDARPFSISEAVKLSQATDATSSAFAVYPDHNGGLQIWALVDLANRYRDFISYESLGAEEKPGVFQASVEGVGNLSVYSSSNRIAELRAGKITTSLHDVLDGGQVKKLLTTGITKYISDVNSVLPSSVPDYRGSWQTILTDLWISAIKRILLRVQSFNHGGAFVITPDSQLIGLDVKYHLSYHRLADALIKRGVTWKASIGYEDEILEYLAKHTRTVLSNLVEQSLMANVEGERAEEDLSGVIWFVALLSRVDGCVVLDPNLVVRGFGAIIGFEEIVPSIMLSNSADAEDADLTRLDASRFGSRHRSMMRYCFCTPGSLGIVISQDRDVRMMTRVGERLVLWDGVNLQRTEAFASANRWPRSSRVRTG